MKSLRVVGQKNPRANLLRAKIGHRWKTIEVEIIPAHVVLSKMCFGDTGGWVSKFTNINTFSD